MSILAMVDEKIRRERWRTLARDPSTREPIRKAAQKVVDARDADEEFAAIIELRKVLP